MSDSTSNVQATVYSKPYSGRRVITTGLSEITDSNIVVELHNALAVHESNKAEIEYLYKYYKGIQPIRNREKLVRPTIVNNIVENRANEIVSFYTSYESREPIAYVSTSGEPAVSEGIAKLNDMMRMLSLETENVRLLNWLNICGTSYKMIQPENSEFEDIPFSIYTLDPRNTFVVYSRANNMKPLYAVTFYQDENDVYQYSIYSKHRYWHAAGDMLGVSVNSIESVSTALEDIPIVEYPANEARIGSFELCMPLLEALNVIESNAIDGLENFVQSFMEFKNVDMDDDDYEEFLEKGAIKYTTPEGKDGSVNIISTELNQTQTQVLKEDIRRAIYEICGMPMTNGTTASTSDTGSAVILRNGWSQAEARAKMIENFYKKAERQLMKIVLDICKVNGICDIKGTDYDIKFTRNNYEAIQSKAQVLCETLGTEKIHPQICFELCGAFPDPEDAYLRSKQYIEELQKEREKSLELLMESEDSDDTESNESNESNGNQSNQSNKSKVADKDV